MPQPASAPGYKPRSSTNDLKEVIEENLEELFRIYDDKYRSDYGPMHKRVRELMEGTTRCGDPHFGFLDPQAMLRTVR